MPKLDASRPRYEDITETTGGGLTSEAAQMMATRYALAAEAAASTGYEIRSHRVEFYGLCAGCR